MGDRANVFIISYWEDQVPAKKVPRGVYLKTHWLGSEMPRYLQRALRRGKDRGPAELAVLLFHEMTRDSLCEPGDFGISCIPLVAERPTLQVDLEAQTVALVPSLGWGEAYRIFTVEEFCALPFHLDRDCWVMLHPREFQEQHLTSLRERCQQEGQELLVKELYEQRMARPLSRKESNALSHKMRTLGPYTLCLALLDQSGRDLARWLVSERSPEPPNPPYLNSRSKGGRAERKAAPKVPTKKRKPKVEKE